MNKNSLKSSSNVIFSMLYKALIVSMLVNAVGARLRQNNAELMVSCDNSVMKVQMTFKYPFSGIVFVPEHYYDPTCSYGLHPNSTALEITLTLLHDSCKMQILNVSNKLIGFNTIAVFHHRMLETVYDYIQNVTCELKCPITDLNKNIWSEPVLNTWISFENPLSVLPEDIVDTMGLEDALLLVYHVKDRGLYRDMVVMNCIGHDDRTVNQKTNFYQISSPFGCSSEFDLVSNFTAFRNPLSSSKMIAYAVVKNFSIVARRRLYITCGAEICKDKCERKCGAIDHKKGFYFSDIVTKGLVKRPEGSKRPASLTAFERFDRQRRSHEDVDLFFKYAADEQNEFLLEKISVVSPYSVIQSDAATIQTNQNGTTQDSEQNGRSKRAIRQFETELISPGMNVIVIKSEQTVDLEQSTVMVESALPRNNESYQSVSSDLSELDSIVKIKVPFEPKRSTRIDGEHVSDRFSFSSFLRALVAIFALICISGVCYFLFSFRRHPVVETVSDYTSQAYF
ncbi:uncharacterized protein [Parasteatoda tepidariorum]|uniref:uncharacterized protein n=1 Tax=Parasteatoda tepidariorum TaxID=114398 RepID=UPI001C726A77|nr:uncharacterized protein LOC107452735 [Parasteatoda tepidariorum]